MSFSLEGTGIPGPHMMRENKFPENSPYRAIGPVARQAEAPTQAEIGLVADDPQPHPSAPETA